MYLNILIHSNTLVSHSTTRHTGKTLVAVLPVYLNILIHSNTLVSHSTTRHTGKTLVAVLPVYLNALSGEGAFVVTTSDYLSRRDGETMGQVDDNDPPSSYSLTYALLTDI